MEDLVNKIFSDEPQTRKKAIIKSHKKNEKNDNLSVLIMSEAEESESDNKNKYNNEKYKQSKQNNKKPKKKLMSQENINLNNNNNDLSESPKHEKLKTKISLNKTYFPKKKKKHLSNSIENKKINLNNNLNDIYSNEKNNFFASTSHKNTSKNKKTHQHSGLNSNNIELKSKFKKSKYTFPSNKYDKSNKDNNLKENKKVGKPILDELKKKIHFVIKEEENGNESIDDNDEEEDSIKISYDFDKFKKHKNNKLLYLKSDGNIDNALNKINKKYNDDNSKKSKYSDISNNLSISKKRKQKKHFSIRPRKNTDQSGKKEKKIKNKNFIINDDNEISNEKEKNEITDFKKYLKKPIKKSNSKKKTKIISSNNIKLINNFQFCHPGFKTTVDDDLIENNIQKNSNEIFKPKNNIINENDNFSYEEDSKSSENQSEEEITSVPRKTRQELKNRKTMKLERGNFKSSKKPKIKNKKIEDSLFQVTEQVNNINFENHIKKFDISKFEIVKLDNLISIEKNDKSFFRTSNFQQNLSKIPIKNFDGEGSNTMTNNNLTNNIIIYRKESNRKKTTNDGNLIEDIKNNNNEKITEKNDEKNNVDLENIKSKKNDKKGSVFCCL